MNRIIIIVCALLSTSLVIPAAAGAGGASSSSSSSSSSTSSKAPTPMLAVDRLQKSGVIPAVFLKQLAYYIVSPCSQHKQVPLLNMDKILRNLIAEDAWKHINAITKEWGAAAEQVDCELKENADAHRAELCDLERLKQTARVVGGIDKVDLYQQKIWQTITKHEYSCVGMDDARLDAIKEKLLNDIFFRELMVLYFTVYGQLMGQETLSSTIPHPFEIQMSYERMSRGNRLIHIGSILTTGRRVF